VDVESDSLVSGGNFLVLELALALDSLRVAIAHVAAISERRLAVISGRSAAARRRGETTVPGLLWYSASAQLAELRHLANPVSLAGTALSEGVEDHATNAPLALQLLERSLELTKSVLSIEAVSAAELAGLPVLELDEVYSALLTEASRTPGS
jgi:histidine ammonia-lyase